LSNSDVSNSTVSGGSTVTDSDITGDSTVDNSTVTNSTVDDSTVDNSTVTDSTVDDSDVTDSTVDNSDLDNSTVDNSDVTNSDLTDSTATDSTITDSTLINSTATNSTVINSTLINMIVEDAWIEDGVIYNGTISDDVFYNATENGPANLTDVVNYPPTAVMGASPTSGTATLTVNFDGSGSTDPNIPGPLNDSLSYSWDFNNDGTEDATGVSASNGYAAGTHTATLTVTDSFGRTSTDTATITVSASSGGSTGGGSSGGGGGGGIGRTYILVLTEENPTQSLKLRAGDTVKYLHSGEDFSFIVRYMYADQAKMGISRATGYKAYSFLEGLTYNLNLDDEPKSDISVKITDLQYGSGNFTFSLLDVPQKKPILILPPAKKTVTPEGEEETSAEVGAELEAEPEEAELEDEEVYSEGVLDFIESLNVKRTAPLWAGIGLALLIILLGLGLYYLVTKKDK
jgi:PKD repeat protein